jgi:hypothetical protein
MAKNEIVEVILKESDNIEVHRVISGWSARTLEKLAVGHQEICSPSYRRQCTRLGYCRITPFYNFNRKDGFYVGDRNYCGYKKCRKIKITSVILTEYVKCF